MKIVELNITNRIGSTGRIVRDLADCFEVNGHSTFIVSGYSIGEKKDCEYTLFNDYPLDDRVNTFINRVIGTTGYRHKKRTEEALEWIDTKKPDLIHLHNIHGDWINIPMLFDYLEQKKLPVIWTLHDCWAFTGRCSHFELNGCEKWREGCYDCNYKKVYPFTYFVDKSKKMWRDKFDIFCKTEDMILVCPSKWLAGYVKQSFLKKYDVNVINNGINTDVFNYRVPDVISGERIILAVANSWSATKGLDDLIKLADIIDKKKYRIVAVGLNERQMKEVPDSICKYKRTNSAEGLANLYRDAFVYVNFTYQDNFPTTNLESLCCGCPVVTYDTGGSPESLCVVDGYVVPKGNFRKAYEIIDSMGERLEADRALRSEKAVALFSSAVSCRAYAELISRIVSR